MDELLSVNQIAHGSGYSAQEIVDSLRAGYIAPYCAAGRVYFPHPELMPVYKHNEVYIRRAEVSNFFAGQMHKRAGERIVSRTSLLGEVGKLSLKPARERRRVARMALAVYEGAAYDDPEDRYLAGVRDTLRELCLREGVWGRIMR